MTQPHDWQPIDRYLAGEASAEEIAAVEARRHQDPPWATTVELLHAEFNHSRAPTPDIELAWARLRNRIETNHRPQRLAAIRQRFV